VKLDCKITCIDPRQEWLDKLPDCASLKKLCINEMPTYVEKIPEASFVVLMTMGHSTDKPILLEILRNRQFPYIGVIGSDAKAARLHKDIDEAGLPCESKQSFYCPLGLSFGTNHPQEIAISIVAQLLQERDKHLLHRKPESAPLHSHSS
jgi:xanthine dehydrogenase accessory factor